MGKKWKSFRLCAIGLALALLLIGYGFWSLLQVQGHFQHLWLPPAQKQTETTETAQATVTNAGLFSAREAATRVTEQLEGACDHSTLFAIASPATVSVKDGESKSARLEAIQEDAYALKPISLYSGRLIYPEEFQRGERVAMVDEQLAVALFQYAEPIEREILIAGESYRIVGIVRDHKQVGDQQEYSLYVPFLAIERSGLPLTALCLEASPIPGSGGWSAFSTAVASQISGGTTVNLQKEKENALMPVRILGVAFGLMLLFHFVGWLNLRAKTAYTIYRRRLMDQYAARLLPLTLGHVLLLGLGYAIAIFAFAQLFVLLISPVYTFPEWVPAVLVEPQDIAAAFWNVWQGMASVLSLRSPEVLRVSFFARVIGWSAGGAALAAGILWGRIKGKLGGRRSSLPEE